MKKATLRAMLLAVLAVTFLLTPAVAVFGADTFTTGPTAVADKTRPRDHIYRAQDTGNGAVVETLNPGFDFELLEVRLHLSAASATAENFTVTLDSGTNAVYDAKLLSKDMNGVQDYIFTFTDTGQGVSRYFENGDEIDFAWTNTNARTWGLEVLIRRVH